MITKKIKSIHTQLIFFYSITVVSMLALIALAFYWEAQNVMNQADYNFIKEEASNIQAILNDKIVDQALLKKTIVEHPLRTRNSLYRYYVRLLDENGKVTMETPGVSDLISVPDKEMLQINAHDEYTWNKSRGDNYLVYVLPVNSSDGEFHGFIQIALDSSYQHSITHDRRVFFLLLLMFMLLSLFVGKFVTNRGLKSLDILTDTVKTITTSSLNQRVVPVTLPQELVPLGEAFNQMLDRIETSFKRMHQMSADMSHELRTPITNLIGQTELLLSYDYSKEDYRNALASNLEELQRMSSLIENILFLARAESQQPEIEKQPIDVMEKVAVICEYYQPLADENDIKLIQRGHALLSVNIVMFRRMLSNLISNALKYTPHGGTIAINLREQDDKVEIIVADTGVGIATHHLPRLFDRFYRVDDARSAQISGTGLGLAIVKSIVDLHHGSISVHSELGVGTQFIISLPK